MGRKRRGREGGPLNIPAGALVISLSLPGVHFLFSLLFPEAWRCDAKNLYQCGLAQPYQNLQSVKVHPRDPNHVPEPLQSILRLTFLVSKRHGLSSRCTERRQPRWPRRVQMGRCPGLTAQRELPRTQSYGSYVSSLANNALNLCS